jgi:hypothetical protein
MEYQLVLQFPSSAVDYDALIRIEDLLINKLKAEDVDGHDLGSGECNIFILTNNPHESFARLRAILEKERPWQYARVAFRKVLTDEFTILWPPALSKFAVQ